MSYHLPLIITNKEFKTFKVRKHIDLKALECLDNVGMCVCVGRGGGRILSTILMPGSVQLWDYISLHLLGPSSDKVSTYSL